MYIKSLEVMNNKKGKKHADTAEEYILQEKPLYFVFSHYSLFIFINFCLWFSFLSFLKLLVLLFFFGLIMFFFVWIIAWCLVGSTCNVFIS